MIVVSPRRHHFRHTHYLALALADIAFVKPIVSLLPRCRSLTPLAVAVAADISLAMWRWPPTSLALASRRPARLKSVDC